MASEERKLLKKKTKYANDDNYLGLAETCQRLGELYKDREEHQRALNEYKLAAKAYEKLNRFMDRGLAYRMIGEMHLMMGQFKEALLNVQAYMRAARKEVNTMELQRANVTLGRVYLHRAESHHLEKKTSEAEADLIEAEKAFHMGLSICNELQGTVRKSDIIEMQAGIYLNLGVTLDRRGKTDIAQDHMERAIRLAREADLFELLHTCYNTMALSCSKWEKKNGSEHCGKTLRLLNRGLEVASRLANRASKMCQTLLLKANFFLQMGDFQSARQTLKRAYHLKTPVNGDAKQIAFKLKVLMALCRTEDELITVEATNYAQRKTLYERMGDGACKLGNFPKGIDFYRRMLECAEAIGEAGRQLIPCYVSLYQTYTDNRQYDLALQYLWKEHEIIADEPKEAYHTLLQIAKLYERQSKSFFDIDDIYRRARAEAKKLKSIELERVPVQRALKLLRANCMDLMADNLEQEAIATGVDLTVVEPDSEELPDSDELLEVDEEDGEHSIPNIGDEINLDIDLSDNSDVEGEANMGGGIGSGKKINDSLNDSTNGLSTSAHSRTRKRGMTFAVRRNNKGETQLHQASIAGNSVLVERLLEQGHPVNVRDHAGWLPLHEACIHGHADIVTTLLDRGAHLNDKGGTSCDGITPLYDACCNGQLDVIEVLLDRGANATQRTDFGDTTLNILEAWYAKRRVPLSPAECSQYERVRGRLVAKFDAAAIQITPPTPEKPAATAGLSSSARKSTRRRLSSDESVSPPVRSPPDTHSTNSKSLQWTNSGSSGYGSMGNVAPTRHRNAAPGSDSEKSDSEQTQQEGNDDSDDGLHNPAGVGEYRSAMVALRNSKIPDQRTQRLSLSAQKKRLAHMTMNEIDADDWLIDDVQQSAKRSRVSRDLQRTSLVGLERKKSFTSQNNPPLANGAVEDKSYEPPSTDNDPTARYRSLLDEDDEDPFSDGPATDSSRDKPSSSSGDSAFNLLMKNSSRSFRRIQGRTGSSEARHSLTRRRSSFGQSSLLDAGFQRVASPSFDEKEISSPPILHSTTPVKANSTVLPSQPPPSVELPRSRFFHVVLDDGKTFRLNYDDQPIPSTRTVGWLQNEVAKRYMMTHGKRPTIKIRPSEASTALCSFSDTDPLNVLTQKGFLDGTTVHAQVRGYEQINFEQFYEDYCQEHKLANDKNVRKWLLKMERSQFITLDPDFAQTVPSIPLSTNDALSIVFLLVFFQQDWVTHLELTMNGITDKDMEKLVQYLPSCRNLRVLRLGMNLLTSRSVEMLCYGIKEPAYTDSMSSSAVTMGGLRGSMLEELDLSHNPLQDVAVAPLCVLCSGLSNLRIIRLRSTDITTLDTLPDHPGFDVARLEAFDVSENRLTEQSVQYLLQQFSDGRLREAYFHSLAALCDDFKSKLFQTIATAKLDGLKVLNLTNCRLSDDEIESTLLPNIGRRCEKLTHLDLSMNVALTKRSFLAVFRQCNNAAYRLEQVRFAHVVQLWADLDTVEQTDPLLQLIEFNPASHYPLEIHAMLPVRGYTSERYGTLVSVIGNFWRALWPSRKATTTKHGDGLHVTLSVE